MTGKNSDYQVNRLGFWSAAVAITTGVIAFFLPFDTPGGYTAEHADRVAFFIPKFIAVWTIPLLADTISIGAAGADLADPLLRVLNVSVPFSLYTSFDCLGFWLYAVFGLLVAHPLYDKGMSSKIAAVTVGVFGLLYHGMLAALLIGVIAAADIESWFLSVSGLLLILIVTTLFFFRDMGVSHAASADEQG